MSYTLIGKHEKDKRANRDGYVTAMIDLMGKDDKIVHIDCDLEGCINVGKIAKEFPDRVFNAGIAEQNAMGVASGLAATGYKVFMQPVGTVSYTDYEFLQLVEKVASPLFCQAANILTALKCC